MDRRRFIQYGVAGAGSGAALGRTVGIPGPTSSQTEGQVPDMESYLARIDAGLAAIDGWRMADVFRSLNIAAPTEAHADDARVRDSLKTLFLTGMFGDLPAEGRAHPGMQERIQDNAEMMDRTIRETVDYLRSRSPAENAALKSALSERSNPGLQIGEKLDDYEQSIGMSLHRRLQTRDLFAQTSYRLAHQNPATVYHEYIQKVEKMSASRGSSEALNRRIGTKVGEKVFWENGEAIAGLVDRKGSPGRMMLEESAKSQKSPGSGIAATGIAVLGISLLAGLAGGAAGADVLIGLGLIGATVGAILLVIGIIVAIIGAIAKAAD